MLEFFHISNLGYLLQVVEWSNQKNVGVAMPLNINNYITVIIISIFFLQDNVQGLSLFSAEAFAWIKLNQFSFSDHVFFFLSTLGWNNYLSRGWVKENWNFFGPLGLSLV